MRTSIFFRITVLTLVCFFLQSATGFAQSRNRYKKSTTQSQSITNKIDVSKLLICKPNSFYAPYVDFAKKSPNYNVMAVNITLVSLWNHFTGQATGQLRYNPKTCSFVGGISFRFSDRFYQFPQCKPSGGFNIAPQYPFNPNHLDKAKISINATTGVVSLQLWGSKTFETKVTKGIIHGFEKSANMMIAITSKKESIPVIK